MKHWEKAIVCLLVLALLALPLVGLLGCGKKTQEKVTITIGLITDMTGPAGNSCAPYGMAVVDVCRYINDSDPISGVQLRVVSYDTTYNPSRNIPGYEWCKARGAKIIVTPLPDVAATLGPFAARDKIPLLIQTVPDIAQLTPPGWMFAFGPIMYPMIQVLVEYIGDQWTQVTKVRIGAVGWEYPADLEIIRGVKDYCEANPDKYEFVGSYTAPVGTVLWGGAAAKLVDCDYIELPTAAVSASTFITSVRGLGYSGNFFCTDALGGSIGLLVDKFGWQGLDGFLTVWHTLWWNAPVTSVTAAIEALGRYRPDQKTELMTSGSGYSCVFASCTFWFDQILRQAVEEVGAEKFASQDFYNAALNASITIDGYRPAGYTETKRYALNDVALYRWSAADEDLIRIGDWYPVPQ